MSKSDRKTPATYEREIERQVILKSEIEKRERKERRLNDRLHHLRNVAVHDAMEIVEGVEA